MALILRLLTRKANATSASLLPRPESPTHPSPALPPPSTHSCLPFASAKHLLPPAPGNYLPELDDNSLFNPEQIRADKGGSSSTAGMHSDYGASSIPHLRQSTLSRNRVWSGPHCQGSGGTWAGLSEVAFDHPTVHFVLLPKKTMLIFQIRSSTVIDYTAERELGLPIQKEENPREERWYAIRLNHLNLIRPKNVSDQRYTLFNF